MQSRLVDNRVAKLKELEVCYLVDNSNELRETNKSGIIAYGKMICNSREEFEKFVKKSYEIKNVEWLK